MIGLVEWDDADVFVQVLWVFGEAGEFMREIQMGFDAEIQLINVIGSIFGTILDADHQDLHFFGIVFLKVLASTIGLLKI